MRLVLVTGKGGTGKSTVAAATALLASDEGRRTLLCSTDAAHSLCDVWDRRGSDAPVRVAPNLWLHEVNVAREIEAGWSAIAGFVSRFLRSQGMDDVLAEELSILPGAEEAVFLLAIERALRRHDLDLVIVDCAPTASTVRLLAFPEAFHKSVLDRLLPKSRRLARALKPVAEGYLGAPVPGDDVFDAWRDLAARLSVLRERMTDGRSTTVRVVVNPQRTVIRESERLVALLHLFGLHVDAVIVNRVDRSAVDGQAAAIERAVQSFAPIPCLPCAARGSEVVGPERLRDLGWEVYGERSTSAVLHRDRPTTVAREGRYRVLTIHLPHDPGAPFRLEVVGEDLWVEIGSFRQALAIPRALRRARVVDAELHAGSLRVRFEQRHA